VTPIFAGLLSQHFYLFHLQKQVEQFFAGPPHPPFPPLPFDISGLASKPGSNLTGGEQVASHLLNRCEQVDEQARPFPTIDDVKKRDGVVPQGAPPHPWSAMVGRILNQHGGAMPDNIRRGRP
jgi:hypothetical protein